jgi:FixJ family two-component response regulator
MRNSLPEIQIIDSDPSVHASLEALLMGEGFCVRNFSSAEDFLREDDASAPVCIILDVKLPGQSGIQLQRILKTRIPAVPLIFITGDADIPTSVRAMKEGAIEFLTKPFRTDAVMRAVRSAMEAGQRSQLIQASMDKLRHRYARLTPRERAVLPLIVSGSVNRDAAVDLGISANTIKVHRASLMRKMEADSLAALIRMTFKLQVL